MLMLSAEIIRPLSKTVKISSPSSKLEESLIQQSRRTISRDALIQMELSLIESSLCLLICRH